MCFSFEPIDKRILIRFLKNLMDVTLILSLHMSQSKLVFHFLILKVNLSNGYLSPDLHIKSTERHQFLQYTSSHPDHTKRSIIYCQALRISRICSNKSDFLNHLESMKSWFELRGYPNKLTEQEMEKVKFFKNGNVVRQRDPRKGVPFVLMYPPN